MAKTVIDAARSSDTMFDALNNGAEVFGNTELVYWSSSGAVATTVRDVHSDAQSVARGLAARGVGPGDVVAVQLTGGREAAVAYRAVLLLGAVLVPIVHIYGPTEVVAIIRQSGARAFICADRWRSVDYTQRVAGYLDIDGLDHVVVVESVPRDNAAGSAHRNWLTWDDLMVAGHLPLPSPDRTASDVCLMIFTSGTTADPKGVLHSHSSLMAELRSAPSVLASRADDIQLVAFPPGHIAGVISVLRPGITGSASVFMDNWDPVDAVELIRRYSITSTSGTPFHLTGIMDTGDVPSLREFLVGAAAVPESLIRRADSVGIRAFRCYGLSEHPTVTAGNANDPLAARISTDGAPLPGVSLCIVDPEGNRVRTGVDGEILTRGPDRFVGYQDSSRDGSAVDPDGWLHTGDLGHLDDDGRLTVTDRIKDVVIRAGETISSAQIENVLLMHPAVAECAVVAAPDDRYGEVVAAVVVPAEGATPDLAEIAHFFAAAGLARQKTPERLVLVDALPRTAVGKVRKAELRAGFAS